MNKIAPQKILHLAKFYEPHGGGVENHLREVNRVLTKTGHKIKVITFQHDSNLALQEKIKLNGHSHVEVVRIPVNSFKSKFLGFSNIDFLEKTLFKIKLWTWILKNYKLFLEADIIQIHDVFWWIWPLYPLIYYKTFITFHGYEGNQAPGKRQIWWHRLASYASKANLCIGGFHRKWYGVSPSLVSFGAVGKLKPSLKKFSKNKRIIFVGRLAHDNGILEYLWGFKLLVEKDKNWVLDIYGDGPLLPECKKFIKKHNLPVKMHGFVKNAGDQIMGYDIAFVSRYLAIIEALASGVRVVAHHNNAIKFDYLKLSPFARWIEIVRTPAQIHKAISKEKELVRVARRWACLQTWEKMVAKYKKVWSLPLQ